MRLLILLVIQGILLDLIFFVVMVHVYLILLEKVPSKFPTWHLGHCQENRHIPNAELKVHLQTFFRQNFSYFLFQKCFSLSFV